MPALRRQPEPARVLRLTISQQQHPITQILSNKPNPMIRQVEPNLTLPGGRTHHPALRISALAVFLLLGALCSPLSATPIPANLGNGLRTLIQKQTNSASVSSLLD